MTGSPTDSLALNGGVPVRTTPFVTVYEPAGRTLGAEELRLVTEALASGVLSSTFGAHSKALEATFSTRYGVEHTVACSSGTAALHLAVAALDPEPGDEIITSPISDFGSVIPILLQNAVPVFADVDAVTGQLDPESVEKAISDRTRAILAVHLLGAPAPVEQLADIAARHGLVLIEDCAQAFLTETEAGSLAGTVGDIGCFSLQQSKHITAGDGGLAITSDAGLARRMRLFSDKGWPRDTGERTYLFLGANYRMSELQAAVARAQLAKLNGIVARRRSLAGRLTSSIEHLDGLTTCPVGSCSSYWQFPIVLDRPDTATLLDWAAALGAEGIPVIAPYIPQPLYLTPVLREGRTYGQSRFPLCAPPARQDWIFEPGLCPVAERLLFERLIVIPWNENYTDEDVDDIAKAVRKVHTALIPPVS
ncbi:MAG: DegT/DnrJ/EryC1/StrS family aminotransferase [Acetobacteraceae bacterium]